MLFVNTTIGFSENLFLVENELNRINTFSYKLQLEKLFLTRNIVAVPFLYRVLVRVFVCVRMCVCVFAQ